MNERPSLTSMDLWGRHQRRCLQLLRDALVSLTAGPADEGEVELNRQLYQSIVVAEHAEAVRSGGQQLSVVVPEGHNPPVGSDAERVAREHKVPDFYWAYIDHLSPVPKDAARQFVVECKRLTMASKSWDYTDQYVEAGVQRFITVEHAYGKEASSGAMVGYLQAMNTEDALKAVNASASVRKIPTLTLRQQTSNDPVELDHELARPFPISPFSLRHFWICCSA